MNIIAIGINHRTSPIETREKFFLRSIDRELLLSELKNQPSVLEALTLSTCNRTEIYASTLGEDSAVLLRTLFSVKKILPTEELQKQFYLYRGKDAVVHLLRVACGLDSLIVGEQQILGQLKEAVLLSRKQNMIARHFNILTHIAIRAGKKAQTETKIGAGGSSVSWAAVTMAEQTLGTLEGKSVLIVGAGKMGSLVGDYLKQKNVGQVYVMNRSEDKGALLARQLGGAPVSFWDMREILNKVDVCICSVGAPHYLIEKDLVEPVMKGKNSRRLVFIDISMPRNIHPNVGSVKNVSLLTIDDLDKVVEDNVKKRFAAVGDVEQIIFKKVDEFYFKISRLNAQEFSVEKCAVETH